MRRLVLLVLPVVVAVVVTTSTGQAARQGITGSGCSVSVPGYLTDLAKAYQRESGIPVVVLGGGSILGLKDLREGRTDFAASCMSKQPTDPAEFTFITAAWDALVFIAHRSNPVQSITAAQVRDIYQGRLNNWRALGGPDLGLVSVMSTTEGMGGVGESLTRLVLKGMPPTPQPYSSMQASSAAIWEQVVETTPAAFATTGFASARKRNVKMLQVNGVSPTKETIISNAYPFRRPLYLVINSKTASAEVRRFVDYVLSVKGQAFISSLGIPSLHDVR